MKLGAARWLRLMLIGVLLMALVPAGALASSKSARINGTTKIYQSPSTKAKSVVVSPQKVKLEAYSDGWARVSSKGKTAYIPIKYVTLTSPVKVYTTEKVTIYKKAGSGKLGTAERGTELYFIGLNGKYAHVQNKSGSAQGYVRSSSLSKTKPSGTSSGSGSYGSSTSSSTFPSKLLSNVADRSVSKIEYTIYIAQQYIGYPYASHAHPPKTFDCAKFCHYCYGKAKSGAVRNSSKTQGYDDRYMLVGSIGDLKRGDMVCFDTVSDSDLCDHTGIYLGDGKFIHASSAAGMVIVSDLKSGYYKRVFSWGRRIFYD